MLTSIKFFFYRNDVRTFLFFTAAGGLLQFVSRQYLKRHPELLKDASVNKKSDRQPRPLSPRGGALIDISFTTIQIAAQAVLNFLAEQGLLAGVLTGGAAVISKIPASAISNYLRDSFPQNLPHLEKKKFILVNGEKIFLDQCDNNLEYLFKILEDKTIPFEEKQKAAHLVVSKYLDLKTPMGRLNFVLCIIGIASILSIYNPSGLYILFKNLIKAIKEGRLSKAVARYIIRKLKDKGIPIDPELLEAAGC
jgi:hypothetical protein